jgi:hypothetical protein
MGNNAERYTYRIEWSQEDGIFVARCVEFPGLGAHGHSQEEALRQIKVAVTEAGKVPSSVTKQNFAESGNWHSLLPAWTGIGLSGPSVMSAAVI